MAQQTGLLVRYAIWRSPATLAPAPADNTLSKHITDGVRASVRFVTLLTLNHLHDAYHYQMTNAKKDIGQYEQQNAVGRRLHPRC